MVESPRAVVVGPGYIGAVHGDALRRNGVEVTGFVGTGADRVRLLRLGDANAESARGRRWVSPNLVFDS